MFHCSVSGPQGEGQQPSPLTRCVQAHTPILAVGDPSPTAAFGKALSTICHCSLDPPCRGLLANHPGFWRLEDCMGVGEGCGWCGGL